MCVYKEIFFWQQLLFHFADAVEVPPGSFPAEGRNRHKVHQAQVWCTFPVTLALQTFFHKRTLLFRLDKTRSKIITNTFALHI